MIRFLPALLAVLILPAALAQSDPGEQVARSRAAQIVAVMQGTMPAAEVFSPGFLEAVPAERLAALTAQLVAAAGPVLAADEIDYRGNGAAGFTIVFEKGRAGTTMQLAPAPPHPVAGLLIGPLIPAGDDPHRLVEDLAALPGRTGLGVFRLGDDGGLHPLLAREADQLLAIGSTFKLYVLSALVQEIAAGRRKWADVVALDAHSLPSGQMQTWPVGTPVTLQTLATMMISVSDNTATDVLIRLLGREAVEAELVVSGHADPARSIPFLTTIESFALKAGDPARVAEYAAADDARQRALLARWAPGMSSASVPPGAFAGGKPIAIDSIEWFASAEDLARILRRLRDSGDSTALDILAVNKALPPDAAARWNYVGFKGGSEPGVINGAWLLEDRKGRWFVVAAGWNNPDEPVDDAKLIGIAARAIAMVAGANE